MDPFWIGFMRGYKLGALVAVGFVAGMLLMYFAPVQAVTPDAQPAPPTVTPCQVVNIFGAIEIARCQPENGAAYLINSHGFMMPVGD